MLQFLLTLAAVAQPQFPPQAPFPPQVPFPPQAVRPPEQVQPAPKPTEYTKAVEAAFTAQKPLIVFVGTPSRRIPGLATVYTASLDGYATGTIVVAVPGKSWMIVRTSLPADATDARIVANIREEVARTAIPFRLRGLRFGEIALPDASDETAMGPWPKSLVIFQGMRKYRSARFTQAIYTLNDRPQIDMVPRSSLKEEWQVPGGMEGIIGWRSDLYKYVPEGYWQQWQRRLPVVNSSGYTQYELGYTRSYPDGTFFVDALSNADGKPFEVRVREKQEGKWTSYIAWKDVSERPVGYHGLTKKCSDCHSQAGTGNYGVAMVSGADTVFSDPFDFSRTSIAGD